MQTLHAVTKTRIWRRHNTMAMRSGPWSWTWNTGPGQLEPRQKRLQKTCCHSCQTLLSGQGAWEGGGGTVYQEMSLDSWARMSVQRPGMCVLMVTQWVMWPQSPWAEAWLWASCKRGHSLLSPAHIEPRMRAAWCWSRIEPTSRFAVLKGRGAKRVVAKSLAACVLSSARCRAQEHCPPFVVVYIYRQRARVVVFRNATFPSL